MVDLIPEDFRRRQRAQRLLRRCGWTCLGIAAGLGIAGAALGYVTAGERITLARFQQLQAQSKAQQARLAEVTARRDAAQKQLQALDALRGGASIGRLLDAVDAALNARIWFRELAFSRGGEAAERKAEASGSGYIIVAKDRRAEGKAADGAWRARERAEIRGLAGDHAVLAEFIRDLGSQPEVRQVKLIETSARSYPGIQVVDFDLAVQLGAAGAAQ